LGRRGGTGRTEHDREDEQEPGYTLGILLIGILLLFNVAVFEATPTFPPPGRSLSTVLIGGYLIAWGLMFLASYYFSHKTFFLRGLLWVCENFSNPRGKRMAFFYFVLATMLGVMAVLQGLGAIQGRY
jgi:hypothetical protein